MRITIVLLILSAACQLHSQMNVDHRSTETVAWFDTLYANCLSTGESQLQDLLHETYMGLNNDLEKRKMYWETEDNIWDLDLSEDLAQALAKNYSSAIGKDFILRDFALKISHRVDAQEDLNLIRQIYTLDHYHDQLQYIDVNYRKSDLSWNNYKKKFYLLLKDFSLLLTDHLSEKNGAPEAINAAWTELNDLCEVMPVRLPSTPLDPGEFGAFYTHLRYYPDWDKKWRIGPDPDVVVRFPDDLHKFVFWRGTNYIPHWVTEKGFWFNNEFNETWFSEGSAEPMSDKQCRYSHVRIIESNDARVIVHWRYALNDVKYDIAWPDAYTGWGDWSDEYYYIYPDAVSVRKVILHTSFAMDNSDKSTDEEGHEWQEGIVVYHPHTRPEEYLHLDAVHVANMKGESGKWSWEKAGEPTTPTPDGSNIVMMNMRSELKPFIISEEGCELAAYKGAQGGSHFRWRDHWPTTTEPTPGRNASGKQAAHGSFFHVLKIPYYDRAPHRLTKVMLHGLTRTSVEELVPVASSWLNPPELEILSEQVQYKGYDQSERAYRLEWADDPGNQIEFSLMASEVQPAINPVIILDGFRGTISGISLDGEELVAGRDFKAGLEKEVGHVRSVIWINMEISKPVQFQIKQ